MDVLIVEDHPLMIEGYKSILSLNQACTINITTVTNCEECYSLLTGKTRISTPNVVILDLQLPPYSAKNIHSGVDLVPIIVQRFPLCKIVILTSHSGSFLLDNILKEIDPHAIIAKSDLSANDFQIVFNYILTGQKYYSESVTKRLKELGSRKIYLDKHNRKIISLLAQGIASKNLPQYLPLSMSAIDKRKSIIRDYFFLGKGSDEDIIREAKAYGFL